MNEVPLTGIVSAKNEKQKTDDEKLTSSNPPQSESNQQPATTPCVKPPDIESEALATMQNQFGLINLDGKVWVFDRISLEGRTKQGSAAKLKLSPRQDGKLLIQRALRAQFARLDAFSGRSIMQTEVIRKTEKWDTKDNESDHLPSQDTGRSSLRLERL